MSANESGAAPQAERDAANTTKSPAKSAESSPFYIEAERLHRAELAENHSSENPDKWPKYQRPGSPEFNAMVERHAKWLRWEAEDAAAVPPAWAASIEPADRLPTEHETPIDTDGRTGRSFLVDLDTGQPWDVDQRVERSISTHVAASNARHLAGLHAHATEHGCPSCWVRLARHRDPTATHGLTDVVLLAGGGMDRVRARWRSHLLASRRVAEDREIRLPAPPAAGGGLVSGSSFLAEADRAAYELWGNLWLSGEALLLVGPPGVGKTTVIEQFARHAISDEPGEFLGQQVAPFDLIVYLAMDRPQQIARSMRRSLADLDPALLDERLVVWQGPPPVDMATNPTALLDLVTEAAGGSLDGRRVGVILDSLKDAAVGLVDDAVGAGYNRARQTALAAGIEVVELHHLVKRGANGTKPTTLADVYGSMHLTAGAGSVVLLWGDAGDPVIELRHLKQPREEVGPLRVMHDHARGVSTIADRVDLLGLLRARPAGLSAKAAAGLLFGQEKPTSGQVEKARRQLDRLVTAGQAYRHEAIAGHAVVWTALTPTTEGVTEGVTLP